MIDISITIAQKFVLQFVIYHGGGIRWHLTKEVIILNKRSDHGHQMETGDAVCFVMSHKYHNVTPITSGVRHSMVIELYVGGQDGAARPPSPALFARRVL